MSASMCVSKQQHAGNNHVVVSYKQPHLLVLSHFTQDRANKKNKKKTTESSELKCVKFYLFVIKTKFMVFIMIPLRALF